LICGAGVGETRIQPNAGIPSDIADK